jgi:alpha-L-rhamnosidase
VDTGFLDRHPEVFAPLLSSVDAVRISCLAAALAGADLVALAISSDGVVEVARRAAAAGWRQAGYELEAYGPDGRLRDRTDRVASGELVLVAWPFAPLASRERLAVRVRAWGADGRPSAWSSPAPVEVGLLRPDDWAARFVTPDWDEDTARPQPCPLLRREFAVRPGVARARLYATALGVYEAHLNGRVVGDHVLAPGWTSYRHRLRYQTFDVTALLHEGRNALGAILGDGWYRGTLGFGGGRRNLYGDRLALLAQLAIDYADGTTELVVTDEGWRAARGPILAADLYDGEAYDARRERPGWATAGHDDRDWAGVRPLDRDLTTLVAPTGPPVRRTELVAPVAITTSPGGRTIVDFGQNLVGQLRLTVRGEAGRTITLRHAEVLEGGELCTRPLRHARATDRYTLRGGGEETWEPRFTFHGFRYAEVDGWPGELRADDLRAVVCHSDWSALAGSSARTRCSTACTRTSSGACAATSSTSRPTARSATSGSAGPATSRSSRRPPATSTTSAASCSRGWPTWPPSSAPRGPCPSSSPTCWRASPPRWPSGASPRSRPGATPR